jgi:hypothetical protein
MASINSRQTAGRSFKELLMFSSFVKEFKNGLDICDPTSV